MVGREPVAAARIVAPRGPDGRRGRAWSPVGSTVGGHGAARAQRPVLVRPVRRAGRGPAPADPGHPHGGHRDRLRHDPGRAAARPCCRRSPTSAPRTPASSAPAWRSCRSSARCCWTGTGPGTRGAVDRRACRWPRRAYATSCRRTSGWCWPTSSGRWRRSPANPYDQGLQLTDASERMLSGLLALAGIVSENMVRDPGWYMLDSGRGLERALQVVALLKVTLCRVRRAGHRADGHRGRADRGRVDRHLPAPLPRPDRRRGGGRAAGTRRVATRARWRTSCSGSGPTCARSPTPRRPPGRCGCWTAWSSGSGSPTRSALAEDRSTGAAGAGRASSAGLQQQLRTLSEAIRDQYQQQPPTQQPMFRPESWGSAMTSYRIVHRTTYTYDAEVTGSYGQFHLRPRDLPWQTCLAHEIDDRPGAGGPVPARRPVRQHQSYFHVVRPHTELVVTAISVVEVEPARSRPGGLAQPWEQARPRCGPTVRGRLGGDRLHLPLAVRGDPAGDRGVCASSRSRPAGRSARRRST